MKNDLQNKSIINSILHKKSDKYLFIFCYANLLKLVTQIFFCIIRWLIVCKSCFFFLLCILNCEIYTQSKFNANAIHLISLMNKFFICCYVLDLTVVKNSLHTSYFLHIPDFCIIISMYNLNRSIKYILFQQCLLLIYFKKRELLSIIYIINNYLSLCAQCQWHIYFFFPTAETPFNKQCFF